MGFIAAIIFLIIRFVYEDYKCEQIRKGSVKNYAQISMQSLAG